MGSYVILYPERGLRLYVYTQCAPGTTIRGILQVIPICRWHPPRRQQHRGPFRLRSSFPKRPRERERRSSRLRHGEKRSGLLLRNSSSVQSVNRVANSPRHLLQLLRSTGYYHFARRTELLCLGENRESSRVKGRWWAK